MRFALILLAALVLHAADKSKPVKPGDAKRLREAQLVVTRAQLALQQSREMQMASSAQAALGAVAREVEKATCRNGDVLNEVPDKDSDIGSKFECGAPPNAPKPEPAKPAEAPAK